MTQSPPESTAIVPSAQKALKSQIDRRYKLSEKGAKRRRAQRAERRRNDPAYREKLKAQKARHKARWNDRIRARGLLAHAVDRGKLLRQPCEVCSNPKSEAHHADYSRPLEVAWLCFKHHREVEHGQLVHTA